ncbi:MAG: succinyl-diaminopimelate desuccinylase [Alphaproteobacteria bacterium]|nr:succinyl-diaminopimelate desuccinylase [Alphaproteobacteria bacterium]
MSISVIELLEHLIECPSVTPKDEGAQEKLAAALENMGMTCHHLPFGEDEEGRNARVPNLFARIGSDGPHLCYAGHTDVVPPGPLDQWTYGPYNPHIENGVLYGRGASDMKGSVAAFAAALSAYIEEHGAPKGSVSMLITGDEEGPALNGTIKVLEWMKEHGHIPDVALVGEPSNPDHLGQEIKIGRRGSLTGRLTVKGKQGHVAYPKRADNPLPRLVQALAALTLSQMVLDEGSKFFQPSNLELTTIDVGNTADNVIPESGRAVFNIRFNDNWTGEKLDKHLRTLLDETGIDYDLKTTVGGESFLTRPGPWTDIVQKAVKDVTGKTPTPSTTGGTSDARFITNYCPVVECGAINATIHQIDENATVEDLENLTAIYKRILELYFA